MSDNGKKEFMKKMGYKRRINPPFWFNYDSKIAIVEEVVQDNDDLSSLRKLLNPEKRDPNKWYIIEYTKDGIMAYELPQKEFDPWWKSKKMTPDVWNRRP